MRLISRQANTPIERKDRSIAMKDTLRNWLPALKKEAELGNPDAMSILSRMHRDGFGAETSQELADHYAEMERNADPFDLNDEDMSDNPWAKPSVEV